MERLLRVVDEIFGDRPSPRAINQLTGDQAGLLIKESDRWRKSWQVPERERGEVRVIPDPVWPYPSTRPSALDSGYERPLTAALLYAHRVVAPSPIDFEVVFKGLSDRELLRQALDRLRAHRRLIDDGVLTLVPYDAASHPFPREALDHLHAILSDESLFPKDAPFDETAFTRLWSAARVAEGLFMSERARAIYAPQASDWPMLVSRFRAAHDELMPRGIDFKVLTALGSVNLPLLRDVKPSTLASIRRNEDALEQWRRSLRSTVTLIESSPSSEHFVAEAAEAIEDYLVPAAARVRKALSRSQALRGALREEWLRFAIGTAVALSVSEAVGAPHVGSVLAATGAGLATNLTVRALLPQRLVGEQAVIARLWQHE